MLHTSSCDDSLTPACKEDGSMRDGRLLVRRMVGAGGAALTLSRGTVKARDEEGTAQLM